MARYQLAAEVAKKMERILIHQLALGPATETKLFTYKDPAFSDREFIGLFDKVAMHRNGKWKLTLQSYKQLDVYTYRGYSTRTRQAAVQNAIRAYDRMKLVRSDPAWKRLLPYRDRGTGICLSKRQATAPAAESKPVGLNEQRSTNRGSNGQKRAISVGGQLALPAAKRVRNGSHNSSASDLSSLSREILELATKRVEDDKDQLGGEKVALEKEKIH